MTKAGNSVGRDPSSFLHYEKRDSFCRRRLLSLRRRQRRLLAGNAANRIGHGREITLNQTTFQSDISFPSRCRVQRERRFALEEVTQAFGDRKRQLVPAIRHVLQCRHSLRLAIGKKDDVSIGQLARTQKERNHQTGSGLGWHAISKKQCVICSR